MSFLPSRLTALLSACCFFAVARSRVSLDPAGIYGNLTHARDCMRVVRGTAFQYLNFGDGTLPNCLRFAFHDAATYLVDLDSGGANGSIMREMEQGAVVHSAHGGLEICHSIMLVLVPLMRAQGCPELTYADAIQHVAATAMEMAGGPAIPLLPGRPDTLDVSDLTYNLPTECASPVEQIQFWTGAGMKDPVLSAAVLNGAHSIGNIRAKIKSNCSNGIGPITSEPYRFDNHYFTEVTTPQKRATSNLMASGLTLVDPDMATRSIVETFAKNHTAFLEAWRPAFQEMSLLGVDPSHAGYQVTDGFCDGCHGPANRTQTTRSFNEGGKVAEVAWPPAGP